MTAATAAVDGRAPDPADVIARCATQRVDDRPARLPGRPARLHQAHPAELRRRPASRASAISVLPLALAAVAQAIVVISGGIDLSIGSMMALTSVVAAALMKQASPRSSAIARRSLGVLVLGHACSAPINGGLVVVTRVPDIVVTLAMSFVWAGCALLVLQTPGRRLRRTGSRTSSPGRSATSGSPRPPSSWSSSSP